MNDLNFKYTQRIRPEKLQQFLSPVGAGTKGAAGAAGAAAASAACVIYVYSPQCGACISRFSEFDEAVHGLPKAMKKRFCCYNAILPGADSTFSKLAGVPIEAYPTIFGFSAKGRVVEYNGSETSAKLKTFLEALRRT
jgi:hypothetical protein